MAGPWHKPLPGYHGRAPDINPYLVIMAGPLAVLGKGLETLIDKGDVGLIDVEPEQPQAPGRAPADCVEELKGLTDEVVVGLVVLHPYVVLCAQERK